MSALACVFGNPIAQSKSPIIHQHFAVQLGIDLIYTKNGPEPKMFESALEDFFEQSDAVGANVTSPFKERALVWADVLTEQAERAGAVNTLIKTSEGFKGANTDGEGIVADLNFHGFSLNGKSVLLIGAGGAAKGALPAIVDAGAASITIYNRTSERAIELIQQASRYVNKDKCQLSLFSKEPQSFDIVINATSLSLQEQIPDIPEQVYHGLSLAYDMVYLDHETVFMKAAAKAGCLQVVDGLGMLVEQAAVSFEHWFSVRPETSELRVILRKG